MKYEIKNGLCLTQCEHIDDVSIGSTSCKNCDYNAYNKDVQNIMFCSKYGQELHNSNQVSSPHIGSTFDSFLESEGIKEEVEIAAIKKVEELNSARIPIGDFPDVEVVNPNLKSCPFCGKIPEPHKYMGGECYRIIHKTNCQITNMLTHDIQYIGTNAEKKYWNTRTPDPNSWETNMKIKIDSICMSIRHDYGIMDDHQRKIERFMAKEYIHAIAKEL
ncbi:hypothetical protein KAR91_52265 [Candidatus Pacearchaeota archaeon]|nr:hypothetical protein [Candidatus Pacearchaeota archaeon]